LDDRLVRAGFAGSAVSSQNRLVDRHTTRHGAYWKSYDFKRNEGTANLFRFPLGPKFEANPFRRVAFEHDGGEVIFTLPNGFQGYLLVNGEGARIDEGPIDMIGDNLKTAGTAAMVNGLSCMACHQNGMNKFRDTVGGGMTVTGAALEKAGRLFRSAEVMDRLVAEDEERFLKVLESATGPFLKVGEDRAKSIGEFPEPIGAVARLYLKDLALEDVAAELGMKGSHDLLGALKANPKLQEMGLAPLIQGAAIKRTEWDSLRNRFLSTYQKAASELKLGTPYRAL
jgi:serine/threonine-protein kinase